MKFKSKLSHLELLQAKEFLNVDEVVKLIGVSKRTVYRLIERNELKANKVGGRTIFKRSDVNKLFI